MFDGQHGKIFLKKVPVRLKRGRKVREGTEEAFLFSAKLEISTGHAVKKLAGRVLAQERLKSPPPTLSQTRRKSINL